MSYIAKEFKSDIKNELYEESIKLLDEVFKAESHYHTDETHNKEVKNSIKYPLGDNDISDGHMDKFTEDCIEISVEDSKRLSNMLDNINVIRC